MKHILKVAAISTLFLLGMIISMNFAFAADDHGRPPGAEGADNRGRGAHGTVLTVSAEGLTLQTPNTRTITVTVNTSTTIRLVETGGTGSLSDTVVGDRVHVAGSRTSTDTIAAKLIVVEPDGDQVRGKVTAVNGAIISVETHKHISGTRGSAITTTITITTSDLTQFRVLTATGSISDVTVGSHLVAFGSLQGDTALDATLVLIGKENGNRPGQGGHGGGPGGNQGRPQNILDRTVIHAAIAEALGMTPAELNAARKTGKSLATLAEEQGVTLESVQEAAKEAAITQINQAVIDGKITQAEADQWIARINNSDFPGEKGTGRHAEGQEDDLVDTDGITVVSSAATPSFSAIMTVNLPFITR